MNLKLKKVGKQALYVLLFLFILLNSVAAFHAYKFTHFYNKSTATLEKPELMSVFRKNENDFIWC